MDRAVRESDSQELSMSETETLGKVPGEDDKVTDWIDLMRICPTYIEDSPSEFTTMVTVPSPNTFGVILPFSSSSDGFRSDRGSSS